MLRDLGFSTLKCQRGLKPESYQDRILAIETLLALCLKAYILDIFIGSIYPVSQKFARSHKYGKNPHKQLCSTAQRLEQPNNSTHVILGKKTILNLAPTRMLHTGVQQESLVHQPCSLWSSLCKQELC